MIKNAGLKDKLIVLLHKFSRFTKQQRVFVLYLAALIFFLVFLPLIKITPVDGQGYKVWLLSGSLFKTMIIVLISLIALAGWNMSFRFKNIIINYFGFKENDTLINFALIWVMATALFSIGDTITVVQNTTSTISVTASYYFIELFLLVGLVLTLVSVIKTAKLQWGKTKIINIVDEDAHKEVSHNKKTFKWLFDEEENEEEAHVHHHHHIDHNHDEEEKVD